MKNIIPGGSQLFSKREYGLYRRAKGVHIWDMFDNKYIDMGIMGVGCCILGYADEDVNRDIKDCIDEGSMSTLNCWEDGVLAKLLLKLHPWADMVRYARTGGEAIAQAIRIARSRTGLEGVAYCGYHGWIHTVPKATDIKKPDNNFFSFEYNNIDSLETLLSSLPIGTVILEPMRHEYPKDDFLRHVIQLAHEYGCIVIFDEITMGFRLCVGGSHMYFDVAPDIAVFGKAISNGYPMAAIIGREYVMKEYENCFISSTYWTERIGPVAALATIRKMQKLRLPSYLKVLGAVLRKRLGEIGIKTHPPNSLIQLEIDDLEHFKKRMLERGYITGNQIYLSYAHTLPIIKKYIDNVREVYGL